MPFKFNPLAYSGFSFYSSSSDANFLDPVATEGDLPPTAAGGAIIVVKANDTLYIFDAGLGQWVNTGITSASFGSSPNSSGFSTGTTSAGGITYKTLTLQPADNTHSGGISTTTQTMAGDKTFSGAVTSTGTLTASNNASVGGTLQVTGVSTLTGQLNANGGIQRSSSGTLSFGTDSNSPTINIGNSGATVNIQGTTLYENVSQLQVTDPLITINKDGAAGSGANSGVEVEENGSITGYIETSANRNSWIAKAPNTAGIATITPGSSGITLDQSSHDPVTLTAIGSSPNADGASLSTQALTLQPADGSNPGLITSGTQTIGGNKTFSGTIGASNLSGTNTGDITLTAVGSSPSANGASLSGQILTLQPADGTHPGAITSSTQTIGGAKTFSTAPILSSLTASLPLHLDASKNITSAAIDLTADVSNVLPIANGGTNSSTTLNNKRVMLSSGGAIVESGALTNGQLVIGNTGNAPSIATLTAGTGISVSNGAGSITVTNSLANSTDIPTTSFTAADNQSSAADVSGFAFANASVTGFDSLVTIVRSSTYSTYKLIGIQKASSWELSQDFVGDSTGLTFSITTAGQVQYTSSSTGNTATVKFRAVTN